MNRPDPFQPRMSEEAFDEYLRICQELYLEMEREGCWPWPDSQNPEDLLESEEH